MLIELMGPSGVGKSTILNALKEKKPYIDGNYLSASCLMHHDYRFYCDFFSINLFLDGVISILASSNMPPTQKMTAINMVSKTAIELAKRYMHLSSVNKNKIEINDEFFLHRSYAILLCSRNFEVDVKWYFQNVPIPSVVIIFRANINTILDRIKERGVVINTYMYLDNAEICHRVKRSFEMYDVAAKELAKRNVKIYYLDAEKSVFESVNALEKIVSEIEASL